MLRMLEGQTALFHDQAQILQIHHSEFFHAVLLQQGILWHNHNWSEHCFFFLKEIKYYNMKYHTNYI